MKTQRESIGRYVIPSVASMFVTFFYLVVDGIFVGRGVGPDALAAVNIALPFAALVTSLADMVAMGGAAVTAVRLGRGDRAGASSAFSAGMLLSLAAAVVISGVGMVFTDGISLLSGANARLLPPTSEYLFYYCAFVVFVVLAIALSAFVRNDGRPGLAFWGMVAGAVANIALDWLFIFPMGMGLKGAAIASGLGQILTVAILATHFLRGRGALRFGPIPGFVALAGKIVTRGVPEFITQMSLPITVLCYNYVIIRTLGETGVTAYAVVCYVMSLVNALVLGVAAGVQPLIGKSYGERNGEALSDYFKSALRINIGMASALYVLVAIWGDRLAGVFSDDAAIIGIARSAMAQYGIAYVIASANILITILFFSTKRTGCAVLVAMARGCGLNILLVFAVPALLGPECVWLSLVAVEAITLGVGLALMKLSPPRPHSQSVVLRRNAAA